MLTVSTILARKGVKVILVRPDQTLREALAKLAEHSIGALLVVDGAGTLVGILSERDIVREAVRNEKFFDKPVRNDLHPTMKPVALVERAVRNSSKSRDIVLDPFGGSGSTLIACEKAGRQARLIELDPKYVDVIILRWQEFSGGTAVLDGDGRRYEEIAAGRETAAA